MLLAGDAVVVAVKGAVVIVGQSVLLGAAQELGDRVARGAIPRTPFADTVGPLLVEVRAVVLDTRRVGLRGGERDGDRRGKREGRQGDGEELPSSEIVRMTLSKSTRSAM